MWKNISSVRQQDINDDVNSDSKKHVKISYNKLWNTIYNVKLWLQLIATSTAVITTEG